EQHLIATTDLHGGDLLRPDQFKTEPYEGPIRREKFLYNSAQADGMLVRRPVANGSPLTEDMFDSPPAVQRGDLVNAIVQTGGARLEVQAVAENDGRLGQTISVRNPRSGRSFHARVEEKGTVVVVPGGQFGLVVETKKS
ncbi:MAG: flagellar basal body P-ring formation chaperone FlgA, partial [Acidobacteriota bacterium]|nr:flagellar basal body P-ring formation chaperone FlgA [Acidobacteriota bacterium]